ncbi:hypothetical protein IH601_06900 [Candidatus Bipolaricaulota bacterium]|nr:hypothetical protein [Candidatus Bipolaricaulota bacterium]TFH11577.1 MAG: hypothetical protein E4H08_00870 [Candidatus Atribacteria bacterium]
MIPSVSAFVHSVSAASAARFGFSATQAIQSGPLKVEAFIRQCGHRFTRVEYSVYQNPWFELEEALSGQVEFTGDELCGLMLHRQGRTTWLHDPTRNVVIHKLGSSMVEPIPGLATLGELSFLHTLAQDFLLRDFGEREVDDQPARRIGLKPKQTYCSHLLSTTTFPIRHATIDFHTETLFPLSISFFPSPASPAASIVGPNTSIRVSYKDVRVLTSADCEHDFVSPPDARVFEEVEVRLQDLPERLPFAARLSGLSDHGFSVSESTVMLSIDADNKRAYATAAFSPSQPSEDTDAVETRLTVAFGNYVSCNMARRRAIFSERGVPATDETCPVTLLDRSALWEERFAGIDIKFAPVEAFFEKESVFWFLSGTGMGLDSIETIAAALFEAQDG